MAHNWTVSICCQGLWDCKSRVLTWIRAAFNDTAICVRPVLDAVFSPLVSLGELRFYFRSRLWVMQSGSGSGPANQEISHVHQDISTVEEGGYLLKSSPRLFGKPEINTSHLPFLARFKWNIIASERREMLPKLLWSRSKNLENGTNFSSSKVDGVP